MISSDLPFAKLRALLLDLGFVEGVVEGKYLEFYHADIDTVFPFRMYRPQDRVSMADLVAVRQKLDWRGCCARRRSTPRSARPRRRGSQARASTAWSEGHLASPRLAVSPELLARGPGQIPRRT